MSKLSYNVSGSGKISAVANGSAYTVDPDHPKYKDIKACLKTKDADLFVQLADIPKTIDNFGKGKITVKSGVIYYLDRPINNSLAKRILWMIEEDFEVTPFLLFLENLMLNPSKRAVEELYNWMEHQCVPITDDGCWIGYKYLNIAPPSTLKNDEPTNTHIFVDVYSRTVRQWIGKVVEMARNEVDDNWGVHCSEGLHVGSSEYSFQSSAGDRVRVLVKVNPKDVVSVPSEESSKCRVCKYEIVDICKSVFKASVVGPRGENKKPQCDLCGEYGCDTACSDEQYLLK